MTGGVYLYFADLSPDHEAPLTYGSFADLAKMGLEPNEGLRVTCYDLDADDQGAPTYLCAEGALHFRPDYQRWCVIVDESTFRSVPRGD